MTITTTLITINFKSNYQIKIIKNNKNYKNNNKIIKI